MSTPRKSTTWGKLNLDGQTYGVLGGFHLGKELWEKYKVYQGEDKCLITTAPWSVMRVEWTIEDNQIYLVRLCGENLLKKLTGSEKLLADWVDKMELSVKRKKVCKNYERKNSYLIEEDKIYLTFDHGKLIDVHKETELYKDVELRSYIERSPAYVTLRLDSRDLLLYLDEPKDRLDEDMLFPLVSDFIDKMLQEGGKDDISLDYADLKNILESGEITIFGSSKGRDIEEMIGSLVDSITDEIFEAKGCLVHLAMHEKYPTSSVREIVNGIERKLGMDKTDSSDNYMEKINPFYFGTLLSDELAEDEVLIRILVSI